MTRQLGPLVHAEPARQPEPITLHGQWVDLTPLDPPAHGHDLFQASRSEPLWDYLSDGPYQDYSAFEPNLQSKAASADPLFFAILPKPAGRAAGYASLMRIDAMNRVIEVGNILYTPALQKSAAGTEAMYLLMRHVFEDLGYRRYEWKCNSFNEPSRAAALRFGFAYEGLFRQHMIIKGRSRDTAWYSLLDSEWPARKAAFEAWLDPGNFDEAGRQRQPLVRL